MDRHLMTRQGILRACRQRPWNGRVLWTPIILMAVTIVTFKTPLAFSRFTGPERLAAWSMLGLQRFTPDLSIRLLGTLAKDRDAAGLVDGLEHLSTEGAR